MRVPGRTASHDPGGVVGQIESHQFTQASRRALRCSVVRAESSLPLPPVGSIRDVGWRGGLWTGRPAAFSRARAAAPSAAARSAGSGEVDVDRARPVDRVRERQPRGVQELALAGRSRPAAPYSGSPQTGWPIACRCTRIWCVRPVSRRTRSSVACGSARSISKCVIAASRGVGVGRHARAHAAVAADRRVDRAAARRRAALDEREVLAA